MFRPAGSSRRYENAYLENETLDNDETQEPFAFSSSPVIPTSLRAARARQTVPDGPSREVKSRPNTSGSAEFTEQLKTVNTEVKTIKRTLQVMTETQREILETLKKVKRGMESDKFDLAKCCHTDNINQLLGKFYTTKDRYGVESSDKERALKVEFSNSPTGISCQELLLRFKKYEKAKFSYWRSEERRRLLGIAGYESLLLAPTEVVTDKVLQLIGQKYSNGCNRTQLQKEIVVARNYIREITVEEARNLKDFWSSFYVWKISRWPNGIDMEEWNILQQEDVNSYDEE